MVIRNDQLKQNHLQGYKNHESKKNACTGCPKINFTFLNVNNVRTNTRIATPAIYIERGDL